MNAPTSETAASMCIATQLVARWFINEHARFQGPDDDRTPWGACDVRICAYECSVEAEHANADWRKAVALDAAIHHLGGHIDWYAIAREHNDYHAAQAALPKYRPETSEEWVARHREGKVAPHGWCCGCSTTPLVIMRYNDKDHHVCPECEPTWLEDNIADDKAWEEEAAAAAAPVAPKPKRVIKLRKSSK